jgi:hypothetical protein
MSNTAKTVIIHSLFILLLIGLSDKEDTGLSLIILLGIWGSTIITIKSVLGWTRDE